ncbi:DUF2521 family protein [Shouchella miscanthi]|uniref:DUF2521 family protein n=1 Tax=Shouchella miscanthi TaxID=2598861 RepID=A0ABU6NL06_9BACI|nr:DUF2521 family protein [Shouchella miscanthi]MED4128898.1 DUF2521 family protein [Shouchella miscanthi]
MSQVVSIADKRREKKWDFERKMLRKIDIRKMEKNIQEWIKPIMPFHLQAYPFLIDQCMDVVIDAFLLGTEYGKYGFKGEPLHQSKGRCFDVLAHLSHDLAATLSGWGNKGIDESTVLATDMLIGSWWEKGFNESYKAHKMRLV